jgi:hypothetical protein
MEMFRVKLLSRDNQNPYQEISRTATLLGESASRDSSIMKQVQRK